MVQLNSEVEFNQNDILIIDQVWLERMKENALRNDSGKYRICIHESEEENLHEMIIIHTSGAYVRPHKYKVNGESLQFIEGEGTTILFNEHGEIKEAFRVGDPSSRYPFFYHLKKNLFHMLLIKSEYLVFKETTRGPFIRNNLVLPDWAPDGKNIDEVTQYHDKIRKMLKERGLR